MTQQLLCPDGEVVQSLSQEPETVQSGAAVGGGAGAVARFMVARQMGHWLGAYLPYGILTVNALGSWMLGFFIGVSDGPA